MTDISDNAAETVSAPTAHLPTSRQLIRSTLIAAVVASVLLVTVVMPAEYGVDPTGMGEVLGLTKMGGIKTALAEKARLAGEAAATMTSAVSATPVTGTSPAATSAVATAQSPSVTGTRSDVTEVALLPGQGREIKLVMNEGARVKYSWSTDRGVVNYDTHADSVTPRRDYHGYAKGSAVPSDEGVLVAAFDGSHGWFWRNRGKEPLKVTLRTEGDYQEVKEVK